MFKLKKKEANAANMNMMDHSLSLNQEGRSQTV